MRNCKATLNLSNYTVRFSLSNKAKKIFYGLHLKEHKCRKSVIRMKKATMGNNWNKVFIIHPVIYDNNHKETEIQIIN